MISPQNVNSVLKTSSDIPFEAAGDSLHALIQVHQLSAVNKDASRVEMLTAIGHLLDAIHQQLAQREVPAAAPVNIPIETVLNNSLYELILASEERQYQALESALKLLKAEREGYSEEQLILAETTHLQNRIEVNRLLRIMWLGTGLAAAGAGLALFLLH